MCWRSGVWLGVLLSFSPALQAGLLSAWEKAQANDPEFQIARADREIAEEDLPLARAALLPQLSAQGALGRAESDVSGQGLFGNPTRSHSYYDTETWALQLRQPLFRSRALVGYRQGKLRSQSAEALWGEARQLLALRLLETLSRLAAARAELQYADAESGAAQRLLEQIERRLSAGEVTKSDLAKATLRQVRATERTSEALVGNAAAEAAWLQLTGDPQAPPVSLPADLADQLSLPAASLEELMALARERNLALRARLRERDIAREELRKTHAERLPTIDLLLSRSYVESEAESTIGNTYLTNRVAVQAALPLFSGGAISAAVRQADARLQRAEATIHAAEAQIRSLLARELASFQLARRLTLTAGSTDAAARLAQRSADLGRRGGTSTQADVNEAESALAGAERDLVHANALALISWARIHEALGALGDGALTPFDSFVATE